MYKAQLRKILPELREVAAYLQRTCELSDDEFVDLANDVYLQGYAHTFWHSFEIILLYRYGL